MNSKKFAKRMKDSGVSPVIATILMVAIPVVLAAVLYVMVSGFTHSPGAAQSAGMTNSQGTSSWVITISSVSASNIPVSSLKIVITGATGGSSYDGTWTFTGAGSGTTTNTYLAISYAQLTAGAAYLSAGDTFTITITSAGTTAGATLSQLSGASVTLYNGGSTLGSTSL